MNTIAAGLVGALCLCLGGQALAQQVTERVPELGRVQELHYSAADVDSQMEDRYIDQTVQLAAEGKLDEDRELLARLQRISAGIIREAIAMKPEAAQWQWEVHATSDPSVDAYCMAGGKILVGSAFVRSLALDDGELATLLGHEVAHAVAEHHRETLSEAMYLLHRTVPLDVMMARLDSDLSMQIRLAALSRVQESEADQLGMVLAHRAGWPSSAMISFFTKLAQSETPSMLSDDHPPAAARLSMAKGMALLFDSPQP